jgi:hypothetical protein
VGEKAGLAECLEGLAGIAFRQNQGAHAAYLYGAAVALREAIGAPLPPADRTAYDLALAATRATLGDERFAAAWAVGRSLSLDQVVAHLLRGEQPGPASDTSG